MMLRTTPLSEQETTTTRTPLVAVTAALTEETMKTRAERRFDKRTAEKALALAATMQTEHQETLSIEEIEAIAAEAGIRPEFLRRALSHLEAETKSETRPVVPRRTVTRRQSRRLTRRQLALMFGVPVAYCIPLFPLLFALMPDNEGIYEAFLYLFLMIFPGLLALLLGATLGRKRQGAIAGAWFAVCVLLTFALVRTNQLSGDLPDDFAPVAALFTGAGAALGLLGAFLPKFSEILRGEDSQCDDPDEEGR